MTQGVYSTDSCADACDLFARIAPQPASIIEDGLGEYHVVTLAHMESGKEWPCGEIIATREDDASCDQCQACMINGVYCHETGCPNTRKVKIDGEWITPDTDDEEDD